VSYEIKEDEPLGESIRRVACEQIDSAIGASGGRHNGKGSPVHETRKHLKKARAALQLLAVEVGNNRFKREERQLRNVARLIAEIRDAEVRLETVKQLRHARKAARTKTFLETEELLSFELDSFLAAFADWPEEAARRLRRAQAGIGHWHLRRLTHRQVCQTVRETYRGGRRALQRARKRGTSKRFHELRKCAKELRYQLCILRPLRPVLFKEMAAHLNTLAERLGHAHDLCFLGERIESIAGATGSKRGARALAALLDTRERDLWRSSLALGEQFYALKPKEFAAQIAYYFDERERARLRMSRELVPLS
jgi:CHAD domain-containing protein